VSQALLLRAPEPDARHRYPLLEGRNVGEFREDPPRLFLHADRDRLRRARVRLRAEDDYRRVRFVVRQTASVPIAALHSGLPFRNSLLAGFALLDVEPELAVGLLNSALYRALHLARRRDARQAVFPQVKVSHLRALPHPPASPELRRRIAAVTRQATAHGLTRALRAELDAAVFDLFGVSEADRTQVLDFVARRGPKLSDG